MAPVFTVMGATGKQGSAVVDQALKDGRYQVRAVTRDVNGDKAKALRARGVEVVTADASSEESLVKAFEGSTAIYSVTAFAPLFTAGGAEHAMKHEFEQGKNIADAAAKTSTLEHFIWSTLPSGVKISNGKYKIPHFEAKVRVDEHIKANPALLAKTTFLWLSYYSTPLITPSYFKTAGRYLQLLPVPPTVTVVSLGDISQNLGKFTSAILAQPQLTLGKYVLGYVETMTIGEILEQWSEATKNPTTYVQVASMQEFDNIWPGWGLEIGLMLQLWEEYGEQAWSGEDFLTSKELGIGGFAPLKAAFEKPGSTSY